MESGRWENFVRVLARTLAFFREKQILKSFTDVLFVLIKLLMSV